MGERTRLANVPRLGPCTPEYLPDMEDQSRVAGI